MQDYSDLLWQVYKKFIISINNKKIPIPYRINIPPDEHPKRQGKSSPEDLLKQLKEDAKRQNFDLNNASVEEIRQFMRQNKLGIDCSGFAYRLLDKLVFNIHGRHLTDFTLPHIGRTNVQLLTSKHFSVLVKDIKNTKSGDLIKLNSSKETPHCLVVLQNQDGIVTYAHSGELGYVDGIQTGQFSIKKNLEAPKNYSFETNKGDGIYRLKVLK